MIDILFGTYGGSNTWYGLCNTLDFWEEELDRKNLFITMDEDDSAYLLEWVFEKYYDKTINEANMFEHFEHWGENYFEVSMLGQVLKDIDGFCEQVKLHNQGMTIEVSGCRFLRDEVISFYERFVSIVNFLLESYPEYKYLVISGP